MMANTTRSRQALQALLQKHEVERKQMADQLRDDTLVAIRDSSVDDLHYLESLRYAVAVFEHVQQQPHGSGITPCKRDGSWQALAGRSRAAVT